MALQFVLGRSGAGKSHTLYQQIIEESILYPERKYFVIVPEQFTMQTQKDLVQMHPRHGIFNIDVLSFMRLAYRVFAEQGGMKRTILEDTGKSMFVRRVMGEKKEELQIFSHFSKKIGYVSEIKSLLSEFYQYDIHEERLEEILSIAQDQPMLLRKLQDMKVMYEGFEALLADKYITTEEILDALILQLDQTELLEDAVLVLDGFTGFTPIQYKLLRKLMHLCRDIKVTVTIDPSEPAALQREEASLFYLSRTTIDKLVWLAEEEHIPIAKDLVCMPERLPRFEKQGQLACLEHNLFRFQTLPYDAFCKKKKWEKQEGGVRFFAGKTAQNEVEYAVWQMARLIREEGYRYRDIAVVTGDMETYGRLLENACKKANFPYFLDYKKGIGKNPLVELVRTVLQVFQKNFDYESMFRMLRCGLFDLDTEQVDRLETYVLEIGIRGRNRWNRTWDKIRKKRTLPEDQMESYLAEINGLREDVMTPLQVLADTFKKKENTVEAYTRALHDFLLELHAYQKLQNYVEKFESQQEAVLAKEYSQVYEMMLEIFDKLVSLLGSEKVTLQEYSDLIETGIGEVKVGVIPPGIEQIVIGDVERTRLKDIKVLFFLGVNEGIVPNVGETGGILTDLERELLAQHQIVLAPTARQTAFTQQFYFYLNLTKPTEHLFLTYHLADGEGNVAMPSSLLRAVRKIFPDIPVEEAYRPVLEETLPKDKMEEMLGFTYGKSYLLAGLREMDQKALADWWMELYSFYARKTEWKPVLDRVLQGVGFINGENPLSHEVALGLYGKDLKNSVTRIEQYAACAYAHFLKYGLRLQERYEAHFGGVDFGNVFHQVLCKVPKALEEEHTSWKEANRDQLDKAVEVCLQEVAASYENQILEQDAQSAYLVERMERIMKRTVWALAQQLQSGDFTPVGYEQHFESGDGLSTIYFDLGEDRQLRLQGQIDRRDSVEEDADVYVKIIDYKSGTVKFDLESLYYGLQLQLVVYLNAAMELTQESKPSAKIHPAGIFYYNIDDPYIEQVSKEKVEEALLKALRMNGLVNKDAKVIAMLDHAFGSADNGLQAGVSSLVIPVDTLKSGAFSKNSKVAGEEELAIMGQFVQEKIGQEAKEMMEGNIAISPYKMDKKTACDYCAYKAVCNFDYKMPGNQYRYLDKMSDDAVWNQMKEVIESEKGEKDGE